ncbi:MAG: tetratricopeptide repeat protein [Candidatus Eisenbacteria bacterium]|uniref:Tetratricopeptide repeat protein n=1 Tax=Eiseniibacteriota bacterium TaxID=2212470 RepID=A0A956NBR3_UNCEI|nr:tetratricopeptide repeat protein [Candidatus Eisenbacteria bacterium]MCB9463944.1 tetratricopeptide repeat protein [Candidatus Eisenbacteria bacterium]
MNDTPTTPDSSPRRRRKIRRRAVGPKLRYLLWFVFAAFAILAANSSYLASISFLEWSRGETYQNYFYQYMFLIHLVLGLLLVIPFVVFAWIHLRNTWDRPNRKPVRLGIALLVVSILLLLSGIALTRLDFFEIKDADIRRISYWLHVITPIAAIWLYVLHRLAGPKISWRIGLTWGTVAGGVVVAMVLLHTQDPRKWNQVGPEEGTKYFEPSLARTASGNFIPARTMMMDDYCAGCHEDAHNDWLGSAHRFSSFNNPAYLFSVRETREVAFARNGDVKASRFCAGCHDPVPFFSGAFDDPNFDDVNHPTSQAGITCTSCHAITNVNSTKGNSDFTIEEPLHYPFAYSDNAVLKYVNHTLVKANPDFHKKTFLKPLHQTAEYCAGCHKVHLPGELTEYKEWLRGQNHYDSYLLSGVSGHGARSFYYPPKSEPNCNGCHMKLRPSDDFAAKDFAGEGEKAVHDHLFPSANTAIAHWKATPETVQKQIEFNEGVMRVDIFGIHEGGTIDGPLMGPIRPTIPTLVAGQPYLLDVVIRTLKMGHHFTQGTVDSNEIWLDVVLRSNGQVIGRSGGMEPDGTVDPWSHFVNVYMLNRDGERVDRRNAQDIYVPLYNHQIPPGAGQVVQYGFVLPEDVTGPVDVDVTLRYRKFDTKYMQYVWGEDYKNTLPIMDMATDHVSLPVGSPGIQFASNGAETIESPYPMWQRWNDYGIGLFMKGNAGSEKGQLRQAANAFAQVEALGKPDGPLNLARVYIKEGRLDDAVDALGRAVSFDPPARRWSVAWFSGLVNKQNGYLDRAITEFRSILEDRYPELDEKGFDFTKDLVVRNELGQTYFERAKMERGDRSKKEGFLHLAEEQFAATLEIDAEDATAHYNLGLIYAQLGDEEKAETHRRLHAKYKPDENARDRAIALQRRANPAADHAAQATVIYPLQREGAPVLQQIVGPSPVGEDGNNSGVQRRTADLESGKASEDRSEAMTPPSESEES